MEVHGVDLFEKVRDIAMSIMKAINPPIQVAVDSGYPGLDSQTDQFAVLEPYVPTPSIRPRQRLSQIPYRTMVI